MDTNTGEVEDSGEELTGRKKSRFKLLKSRLFGRLKRKETEGLMKQSQSASDVTADVIALGDNDSEDDCLGGPNTLGSRALSHDSIFLADQSQSSSEPTRVLSQENVHSRIRELQLKLQRQNMCLGPPPLLIPGKRMEDSGATSEDDGLPQSPPEILFHDRTAQGPSYKFPNTHRHHSSLSLAGTGSEEEEQCLSQPSSRPLSPNPASPCDPEPSPAVDFTSPAQYTPSLDSSAARHRMSVKPRNQRASAKGRKGPLRASRLGSESLSDLDPDQPLSEREEEQDGTEDEDREEEEERERPFSSSPKDSEEKPWESVPPGGQKEVLQRQESSETEGRITTNPLYLQAMTSPLPEPMTKTSILETPSLPTPPSAAVEEPQKPPEPIRVKRPRTLIQDNSDQGSRPGSTSEKTLSRPLSPVYGSNNVTSTTNQLPSKEKPEENMTPATSNKGDRLSRNTQGVSLADTSSSTHHSALPTPAPRVIRQTQRPASERESVRETTAVPLSGVNEETSKLDMVQRTTGQPTGHEDTLPRANSFSTSSSRQRSKSATGSAHTGTRNEEMNAEGKGGEGLVAKNPHQESVRRQEVKPEQATFKGLKENQPQPSPQERKVQTEVEVVEETGLKGGEKRDGQSEGNEEQEQEQEQEQEKEQEQEQERRSAFGVKLRTTSQSLKYRLQRDQEFRVKCHIVSTTAEPVKGEIGTSSKVRGDLANKASRKGPSQVSDCPPSYTPDRNRLNENQDKGPSSRPALGLPRGAETPGSNGSAGSEPVWMSMAREKTRSLQQHLSPETEPGTGGTGGTTTPQYTPSPRPAPTPAPQPRLQPTAQPSTQPPSQSQPSTKTASQKQTSAPVVQPPSQPIPSGRPILWGMQLTATLKALPSDQPNTQTASQPTPQGTAQQLTQPSSQPHMPTRPTLRGASERSYRSLKRAEKMPVEKWTERALPTGTMEESSNGQIEIHIAKPEIPSSSSSSSSSLSHRGQPTWMELAKRKSLAWSDKTMD
ncbi:capping protein-inhibiting regulator of actin dynamics-like isoform X2 [Salvelinus fontinalis]|uniref:capping protein-inhibiting regulator of actin dynamics-like isoform X2 n=1 Tax=Salvelinus fontinalis TaxID=8038 RepID=UPI00248692DB|nr:capping protein-inhibiting regulator of actin dynamics-like isoform X2 [Salvelinus fontinalis]